MCLIIYVHLSFAELANKITFLLQNQNQQRIRRALPLGSDDKFHELTVLFDGNSGIIELEVDGISVCGSVKFRLYNVYCT